MGITNRTRILAGAMAAGLVVGAGALAWAQSDPANTVKYRENLMRSQGSHLAAINLIVKGDVPLSPDHILAHANAIHGTAMQIPDAFPEGSGPDSGVDTEAKAEIWQNWDEFQGYAQNLADAAAQLADAAQGGDAAAIQAAFTQVGQACGACHTEFRESD